MTALLATIQSLIMSGNVRVSAHGNDELAEDVILVVDILSGVANAQIVEEYPEFPKGPCVLVLQRDNNGMPVHAVWGVSRGASSPAVLVAAYRPDPSRWSDSFLRRKA